MTDKPRYKCNKCGTKHKHFDDWLNCCDGNENVYEWQGD